MKRRERKVQEKKGKEKKGKAEEERWIEPTHICFFSDSHLTLRRHGDACGWTHRLTAQGACCSPCCGLEPLRSFLQIWPAAAWPWSAPCCPAAGRPHQQAGRWGRTAEVRSRWDKRPGWESVHTQHWRTRLLFLLNPPRWRKCFLPGVSS